MPGGERVRVLHVITRLIRGGADENTVLTVERVDKNKYETHILAGQGSEVGGFSPEIQRCTRVLPELVRDPNPILDLIALIRMTRFIRKGRYDIVHTHTAKGGFLGRIAARLAGVPHVVHTLHGVTFHDHIHPLERRLYILLERIAAQFCDVMITVGDDVKNKYLCEAIGRKEQYVTIPSGMDVAPFCEAREHPELGRSLRRELGFGDDDVVVGMVSRLEARKGYRYLFEALSRLAPGFPRLKALVVGEGDGRRELESLAERLSLSGRVVFAGYRSDVARAISAFDVAALTSLWEGLPRVLVQYSLLEKPIVTFEVEGAREVVSDGVSGYVVPAKDVDSLAERLGRLVADPELRAEFGRNSREQVDGRWEVDRMVAQISNIYERVGRRERLPEEAIAS
jgi:glycosyltransferase involved in cell wall biosynthesis